MARLSRSLVAALASLGAFGGAAVTMAQPGQPPAPPSAQPPSASSAPGSAAPLPPPTGTPIAPRPTAPAGTYPYPPGTYPYPYGSAYPYGYPPPGGSAYPYPYYYPPYYYPPPGGTAAQRPPPPPRTPPPGKHLHNGFFLQIAPGVIMHRGNLTLSDTSADASTRGLGLGWDISIGATITGGFVLAGSLGSHDANVKVTNNNTGSSPGETDLDYTTLSALAVYYPDPTKGLNFQAGLGFARMNLERLRVGPVLNSSGQRVSSDVQDLTGAGFILGIGYETFVDNEWSIGLIARLEAATMSQDSDPKVAATMFTPSLRLAFTYH